MRVIVIGAGIAGLSTALWLLRGGASVTVVDARGPGAGASFGNAGVLAASAIGPVIRPGTLARAPLMALDRDAPLFLRWRYLPRLLPWLLRAAHHATDAEVARIGTALAPLVTDSVAQHMALSEGTDARRFLRQGPYMHAYPDRAAYAAAAEGWAERTRAGFAHDLHVGAEVSRLDPALAAFGCVAVMPDHGWIVDPDGYMAALGRAIEAGGGHLLQARVTALDPVAGRVAGVVTQTGRLAADAVVLAAGAHAAPLVRPLGLRLPLETERGYHLHFADAVGGPSAPTMIAAGQFVATPMRDGLRCAGVLELGGLSAGPSRAPLAMLRRQVARAFPGLVHGAVSEWMGHRPALPDSLPCLGASGIPGLSLNLGHHHVGLTAGPKSGRLLAQMLLGRPANLDLRPYGAERFRTARQGDHACASI